MRSEPQLVHWQADGLPLKYKMVRRFDWSFVWVIVGLLMIGLVEGL